MERDGLGHLFLYERGMSACTVYNPHAVIFFLQISETYITKLRERRRKSMNTAKFRVRRWDVEKVMITAGMLMMEGFGTVMLFCGILDIKIL